MVMGLLRELNRYSLQFCFFLFLSVVSLVMDWPFLVSQSFIFLVLITIFQKSGKRIIWRKGIKEKLKRLSWKEPLLWIGIPFLVTLLSLFWSDSIAGNTRLVQVQIPLLAIPIVFCLADPIKQRDLERFGLMMVLFTTLVCIFVLINYWINYDAIMVLLSRGKHIPTPSNHIRFSMTCGLVCILAIWLYGQPISKKNKAISLFLIAGSIFLFLFLHILAVRTGIVLLYAYLVILILWAIFQEKSMRSTALVFLSVLILLPFLAIRLVPSLKAKFSYMRWELQSVGMDKEMQASDSDRVKSIVYSLELWKSHPILGTGVGDLKDDLIQFYQQKGWQSNRFLYPHNQYVRDLLCFGLIGLGINFLSYLFLIFNNKNYKRPYFLGLMTFFLLSFLVETTLDTNFGVSLYAVGLSLLVKKPMG